MDRGLVWKKMGCCGWGIYKNRILDDENGERWIVLDLQKLGHYEDGNLPKRPWC